MSGREMTGAPDDEQLRSAKAELPPASYIPEEMLSYPPHSGAAKMVGWNLNGGKRVYLKKITRGRERFTGKWRLWDLDGSRDVAEMEDPEMYFELSKTRSGKQANIVDWQDLRWENWWEFEGLGGPTGQPPLPGAAVPRRPITRERALTAADWGVYPGIQAEMSAIGKRTGVNDVSAVLHSHLNAPRIKPSPAVPHNFVNLFEEPQHRQPIDYMREFATGDVVGEAYTRSIDRFIQGAIAGRTKSAEVKSDPDTIDLEEYVQENYGYGILSKDFEQRGTIRNALQGVKQMAERNESLSEPMAEEKMDVNQMARAAYGRTALRHMTKDSNALDIVPLIRLPAEFTWQGIGGKGDIDIGLRWVSEYQKKAGSRNLKRDRDESPSPEKNKKPRLDDVASAASSPLSAAPGSPVKEPPAPTVMAPTTFDSGIDVNDGEQGLKRMRLELLALTKFYPLAALRKMDKASAERLLPPNVRTLMTNTKR
jgi:bromodomain-containing protein 7/9